MPWYREGTVAITAGQNTVTGAGTSFSANSRVGDAFQGPDGRWYEVTNIASATVMSILPAYQGATIAGGAYGLAPMQGYVKESADRLRQIVEQWGSTLAGLGAVSTENVVPVTKGGTGGTTPAAARTGLELKSAAVAEVLGTVSHATGVPTGALMERGTNANGTYEKFACGTLICRLSLTVLRTVNVAYNGAFAATGAEGGRTFPAVFSSMPAISIAANGTGGPTMIGYQDFSFSDSAYTGWPPILLYGTVARAPNWYTICYSAHGRWFE